MKIFEHIAGRARRHPQFCTSIFLVLLCRRFPRRVFLVRSDWVAGLYSAQWTGELEQFEKDLVLGS